MTKFMQECIKAYIKEKHKKFRIIVKECKLSISDLRGCKGFGSSVSRRPHRRGKRPTAKEILA